MNCLVGLEPPDEKRAAERSPSWRPIQAVGADGSQITSMAKNGEDLFRRRSWSSIRQLPLWHGRDANHVRKAVLRSIVYQIKPIDWPRA